MTPAQVHRRIVDLYPQVLAGEMDEALALVDQDVIDHRGGTQGDHHGREAWRGKWVALVGGPQEFHDVEVTVEQNIASGDTSVNRYRSRATHTASGRRYDVTSMDMIRVRDGRIVEHWALRDTIAIEAQLRTAN